MRRIAWPLLAISSLLLAVAAAQTRPQYGGTLHVDMRSAPSTLDPADNSQPDSFSRRNLTFLVFDTLVSRDKGRLRPGLAVKWQATGSKRWQFQIRAGVKMHDGSLLTTEVVAASLRSANPAWNISTEGDSVAIESEVPDPLLPSALALPRNAIAKRNISGTPIGTGPFHVADWQPGKKLSLAAEENYWAGRPFLDAIEIEFGKNYRDQSIALELGRAELVEVTPEQARRSSSQSRASSSSAPMELLALLFTRDANTDEEKSLREALALSIDRSSMHAVILQGAGNPAASILPAWMSGYGFVFPTDADLARARHIREQVRNAPAWSIGYDADDPVSRLLAERVSLNARDAGLNLQPTSAASSDIRVVRIPLASIDAGISLASIVAQLGAPALKLGESAEELYAGEQSLLTTRRLIPLFHLPVSYASTAALKGWTLQNDGGWSLANAWVENTKP